MNFSTMKRGCRGLLLVVLAALAGGCVARAKGTALDQPSAPLLVTTPAGAQCATGGTHVASGRDENGNGVLDAEEVESSADVCNPAVAGKLVAVSDEPVGASCPNGGTRIDTGSDGDGDGVLDAAEIESTRYLCGLSGPAALLLIDDEPAGPNCQFGGRRVQSGLDDDDDGTLAPGEVDTTEYDCAEGVYLGDAFVYSDADLAALQPYGVIAGNLTFGYLSVAALSLPNLRAVSGSIWSDDSNPQSGAPLVTIDLPRLQTVGMQLSLAPDLGTYPSAIETISAPALERIGNSLIVEGHDNLVEMDFSHLAEASTVAIVDVGLAEVSFPSLREVENEVVFDDNNLLTTVSLDSLTQAAWARFANNAALISIAAPALETVAGSLTFSDNPELATVSFDSLRQVGDFIACDANFKLTEVNLGNLTTVGANILFNDNAALLDLALDSLATAASLTITNNALLGSLSLPVLSQLAESLTITGNPSLTDCETFAIVNALWAAGEDPDLVLLGVGAACGDDAILCPAVAALPGFRACRHKRGTGNESRGICQGLDGGGLYDLAVFSDEADFVSFTAARAASPALYNAYLRIGYDYVVSDWVWDPASGYVTDTDPGVSDPFWNDGLPDATALGFGATCVSLSPLASPDDGRANNAFCDSGAFTPVCRLK